MSFNLADFREYYRGNTIAQADGDTGDSSQRVGTFWVLLSFLGVKRDKNIDFYETMIKAHEIVPGRYRRSPIQDYWGSDPTNFSRDQQSILTLAFAAQGDKKRFKDSMFAVLKRGGFYQNFLRGTDDPTKYWKVPDFITLYQLGLAIRGLDLWLLYPLLLVIDLGLFLDLGFRKTHLWDADNMFAQNLFYASYRYPTPWSRIVFHLYGLTDFTERLHTYHTTSNGIKPLYDLYVAAYDRLRGIYETNRFDRVVIRIIKLCFNDKKNNRN